MNAVNVFSEQEYFHKAEQKLGSLFSALKSPKSNQLEIISQIITSSVLSEKAAYSHFFDATESLHNTIIKNQKRVNKLLSSVDSISTNKEFLVLKSGLDEIQLKLKSPEEILLSLEPKAIESFGYFSKLAFILRNENFVFLQVLLSLKENK